MTTKLPGKITIKALLATWSVVALAIFSLALTAFLFVNGYELASGKDIPLSTSLERVNLHGIVDLNIDAFNTYFETNRIGNFGKPNNLRISSVTNKIPVVPAQLDGSGNLLARTNTGHYLLTTPSKNGSIGNAIVYIRQNWRSINDPSVIAEGDNIFLDTDAGWRYMFRVSSITKLPSGKTFVTRDQPISTLVVVIEDGKTGSHTIVVADYVILQNVTQ